MATEIQTPTETTCWDGDYTHRMSLVAQVGALKVFWCERCGYLEYNWPSDDEPTCFIPAIYAGLEGKR